MTKRMFENLDVYKESRILTNNIYNISKNKMFSSDYGLSNQIRRAAISVMSNIAEGFERGSNSEFAQFLYISKGSAGEVRSQLTIAYDQGYIREEDYKVFYNRCCKISGMLTNLIKYIRKSGKKRADDSF